MFTLISGYNDAKDIEINQNLRVTDTVKYRLSRRWTTSELRCSFALAAAIPIINQMSVCLSNA